VSEPQYDPMFTMTPTTLGVMASHTWHVDRKRLGFTLARYKFVAKMLAGCTNVLEVGCGDAWATSVVAAEVGHVLACDMDRRFVDRAIGSVPENVQLRVHDFVHDGPTYPPDRLPSCHDAAYALDVLEHVQPEHEGAFLGNVCISIGQFGTFICGMPSLESQQHASALSREGHVNCKTQDELLRTLQKFFRCVYLFGMNDETLHTGYGAMCHYRLAICTGAKL